MNQIDEEEEQQQNSINSYGNIAYLSQSMKMLIKMKRMRIAIVECT